MKRDISLQFRRQVRVSLVESKKVINLGILVANQLPSSLAHRIPYYVNASFEFTSAKFRLAPSISTIFSIPSARSRRSRAGPGGQNLLTYREEQVVALVADGLSNRDVASELGLSEHTVKKYLFRIFDKLGISNRVELVLYAVDHGVPQTTLVASA
jgi:DNA-binding NarL/FixJ family response regulator